MKTAVVSCLLLLVSAFLSPVLSADLGLALRAGTHGLGGEFGVGVTPWFGLRAGAYTLDYNDEFEEDGIDYDGELQLGGYGLLADFFPMKGTFRLTAGVLSNRNALDLVATPTSPQEIGDSVYDPSEIGTLKGDVGFDDTVPYFGIGWGNIARGKRVGFLFDLGVIRQGAGDVTLTSTGTIDPEDLALEETSLEADIEDYEYWPIVSFGLSFRF